MRWRRTAPCIVAALAPTLELARATRIASSRSPSRAPLCDKNKPEGRR